MRPPNNLSGKSRHPPSLAETRPLSAQGGPLRPWKLEGAALVLDVAANPDDRLIDQAQEVGVEVSRISYLLDERGLSGKKQMSSMR